MCLERRDIGGKNVRQDARVMIYVLTYSGGTRDEAKARYHEHGMLP